MHNSVRERDMNVMAKVSIADVFQLLPNLSKDELSQVRQRVDFLRSGATDKPTVEVAADEIVVLTVIATVLTEAGAENCTAFGLKRTQMYSSFRKKVPDLMAFVRKASSNRVEQMAILRLSAELLFTHLESEGSLVGGRAMMANIHRIPAVLNHQFPGYARSGMLSWVVRGRKRA